jgi:membrane protein YdbS with pleckstrin-like domain
MEPGLPRQDQPAPLPGTDVKAIQLEPLDPRVIALWRLQNMILAAVLVFVAVVAFAVAFLAGWIGSRMGVPVGLGVAGLLCVATVWLQRWPETEYRHAGYRLDHDVVEIRRGVVWRHAQHVPRSRVQHTDVTQGPLERTFGLATVIIHTAGTQYARVSIEGLDHERAVRVRDRLLPRQVPDGV